MSAVGIVAASAVSAFGLGYRGLGRALVDGSLRPASTSELHDSYPGTLGSAVRIAGEQELGDSKQKRLMSRAAELCVLVTGRVLDEAGWNEARDDVGFFVGVGGASGGLSDLEAVARASIEQGALSMRLLGERGLSAANPLGTFHLMNNFTLCHSAMLHGLRGPNSAFYSEGAGTVTALHAAVESVRSGHTKRALAGGADCILHPLAWAHLLRTGHSDKSLVPAEGAAMLALGTEGRCIGWIEACELIAHRQLDHLTTASIDFVVINGPRDHRDELRRWAQGRLPLARLVDLTAALGEAPAASPALAWVAALDLLQSTKNARALTLVCGLDGQLAATQITAKKERATLSMRPQERTAVITGVGVVSGFGVGAPSFFAGLTAGSSAVTEIRSFDAEAFPVKVAGEVPVAEIGSAWMNAHASPQTCFDEWEARGVLRDRKSAFATLAALEAFHSARCNDSDLDATLVLALGLEQAWLEDFVELFDGNRFRWDRETAKAKVRLRSRVDQASRCVRQVLGLRGPAVVNTSACAAGALAVAHAASLVVRGECNIVFCGGADSMINPLAVGGFWNLGAPSPRNEIDACRPFDACRDGLVIGEGAAIFVVESERRAEARGAKVLARITGWASTQDAYRASAPRPDGRLAAQAMKGALDMAGLDRVEWINAHGTGTRLNDPVEVRAIRSALGAAAEKIPVSSIKGAVGHLMAASGAIEIASCLLAFERDLLAGTAHYRTPDPECDLDIIGEQPRAVAVDTVLTNSFGFGGQNASVVLERPR